MHIKTVCVIDDEPAIRRSTVALVRSLGCEARAFTSAEDFLLQGMEHEVDCVVCDIHMSGMSGTTLLNRLRATGVNVPFIFVSGRATPQDEAAISRFGVRLLVKPIEPHELADLLAASLRI